jgi:hypothetical protein
MFISPPKKAYLILLGMRDHTMLANSLSYLLVWHEICHVIYDQYALKGLDEENHVNGFSQGIVQVLRDNPQFKKWMDKCLKN